MRKLKCNAAIKINKNQNSQIKQTIVHYCLIKNHTEIKFQLQMGIINKKKIPRNKMILGVNMCTRNIKYII